MEEEERTLEARLRQIIEVNEPRSDWGYELMGLDTGHGREDEKTSKRLNFGVSGTFEAR